MLRSLAARFLLASLLLLPILLGASAYMLDLAFRRSLLSGEAQTLLTHVYLLLGAAEFENETLSMPPAFQEPRFSQLNSGLYGIITDSANNIVWRSPSARLLEIEPGALTTGSIQPGSTQFMNIDSSQGELFAFHYDIAWELNEEEEKLFRVSVLHHQHTFDAERESYREQLRRWLGLLAVLIVATQAAILRWGLRPLKALAKDLKAIESGAAGQLAGDYPSEIQNVTDNLNQVLLSERKQRERYRNTLDDLAHSLKTPLAVIRGALRGDDEQAHIVREQVERMNQIVDHQLKRAVISHGGIPGKPVSVADTVTRLCSSLKKVYRDKAVTEETYIATGTVFLGDERDLLELLGNVLENAFKYCHKRIRFYAHNENKYLKIVVEDDGPGIPPEQRSSILNRGARADTAAPGQGIGLAVAVDILSSYGGSLHIDESELGGARFTLTLPS